MAAPAPARALAAAEPSERAWAGLVAGVLAIAALTALDAHWGPDRVVSGLVMIGPFITALLAPARFTAVVGAVAIVVAAVSGAWNENFGDDAYFLRLAVVIAGSGFAVVGATARERVSADRRRFAVLAALADLGQDAEGLDATVSRLLDVLVPAVADVAIVDGVRDGEVRRLGVRAAGSHGAEIERWLANRPPAAPDVELASRGAASSGRAHLIERIDPAMFTAIAADEEDRRMMEALGGRSSITVPLRAGGRILGALSLSTSRVSGRRYGPADAAFAEVTAGRAALALDNAGLFAELEITEAQLSAALGALEDAVTVQAPDGHVVYANDAAARSLGFADAAEMLSAPPGQIIELYDTFTEEGRRVGVDDLPGRKVLDGETPPPLVVRAVHRETGQERWTVLKATAVRDPDGRPLLAVNVIEDVTETRRAAFAQRLLARAGAALSASLDYERTLQQVADLAVPELADWCGVSLPDERGFLRQVAIAHVDPERVRFGRELSKRYPSHVDDAGGAARVLREGVSEMANEIPEDLLRQAARSPEHFELISKLGMRAAMVVPLQVGGRAIGTLTLATAESGRTFTEGDVQLAEELARRAGTAVENARLYTERSHIAATLQAGLLPQPLPDMPGWATHTLYRPAGTENWVGGDFYDAFRVRGGWMMVIGDVAGRGAAAAALTALVRYTIRATAQLLDSPLMAVERLNDELYARTDGALCTLVCVILRDTEADVLCAGHPQPFLVRGDRAEQVGELGPMVGAVRAVRWTPVTVPLAPGDTLVTYTDGVIDTMGSAERFGEDRLGETLKGADGPEQAVAQVEAALRAFGRGEQVDDTAVVAIGRSDEAADDLPRAA
ncbi:MAG TPA: SpoIIE family protein phosphatase [Solirubrobacteraceae bacterium]|jgi:PAS domain S-box-containing protein